MPSIRGSVKFGPNLSIKQLHFTSTGTNRTHCWSETTPGVKVGTVIVWKLDRLARSKRDGELADPANRTDR